MTEPLQLELEATPLPPALRALCVGGPWDGAVMMAPIPRTTMFGQMTLVVKIDGRSAHFRTHADAEPWIGGCYQLTKALAHQQQAQQQVRAILGEPNHVGVYWRWLPGAVPDHFDVCILTERMVRVHVLSPAEPREPYEMGAALRELTDDLDLELHEHPDGDVSFRHPEERPFDYRDLDRIDELLKETD